MERLNNGHVKRARLRVKAPRGSRQFSRGQQDDYPRAEQLLELSLQVLHLTGALAERSLLQELPLRDEAVLGRQVFEAGGFGVAPVAPLIPLVSEPVDLRSQSSHVDPRTDDCPLPAMDYRPLLGDHDPRLD